MLSCFTKLRRNCVRRAQVQMLLGLGCFVQPYIMRACSYIYVVQSTSGGGGILERHLGTETRLLVLSFPSLNCFTCRPILQAPEREREDSFSNC